MSDRQKPKSVPRKLRKGKEPAIIGSGAMAVIEELKKGNGWGEFNKMAGFEDGKIRLPGIRFAMMMKSLGDLTRPDNPSPYMIEYVRVGNTIFLHLVEKPPQMVLDAMARDGSGNYSSSNDVSRLLEGLDDPVATQGGNVHRLSSVTRHPRNPFRAESNYARLVDIIAAAGPRGIDKESWIQACCEASGKARNLVKNDLAVIKSARPGHKRHQSCREGFVIVEHGGRFSIRFE